jgi:pimeloyl-ACP methyl ester carboxylesterase
MEKWIGKILIDVSPPEKVKFKAPLILIHGAWTSSRCWRRWATHLANLGWECWAVNFRGRFEENALEALKRVNFQDCVEDLKQVIRAAEFPPVLLGHDLGGLVARQAAAKERISALVLLASLPPSEVAPELPRALRLLRLKYSPLLFLRRPFRIEEKDFRKNWLNALPPAAHPEALRSLVPESPDLIREFFDRRARLDPKSIPAPILVVAARDDRVAPADSLRRFAELIGAEFREYAGHGHWIMDEDEGEEITRDCHRWVVQKSAEEILLADLLEHP